MAFLHSSSENPIIKGLPCDHTEPNHSTVCESVRYRLLSVQAEPAQNSLTLLPSALPNTVSTQDVLGLDPLLAAPPGSAVLDSLSRHSPRFSHIVLRI
jgi:hypothetical protein